MCAPIGGCRIVAVSAAVPIVTRRVTAATADSTVNGSKRGRAVSESPVHNESNPASSAVLAN
jgi:hypothetical protein